MAENATQIQGATNTLIYLRNYPYASILSDMPILNYGLATDNSRLIYKDSVGNPYKVMLDNSGQANLTDDRVLITTNGGRATTSTVTKTKLEDLAKWLQPLTGLDNRIVVEKVDNAQTIIRVRSTDNSSSGLEFSRQTSPAEAIISSTLSGLVYHSDYNKHSFNIAVDVTGTGAGYYINDVNINTLFEPTLTKGNLTASGSLSASNTRQVIGGDCAISHLTTTGHKHIPASGASGNILGWSSDGTAIWISPASQSWASKWTAVTGGIYYGSAGAQSIGVGVQPELWQNVFNAIQVGKTAAFFGTPSTNSAYFTNNVYFNATWKALMAGYGSRMGFDSNGNIDIRTTVNSASAKNETMDFSGTGFLLKPREGAFLFAEKATAPALTSGYHSVYSLSSDSSLMSKDDSGTEYLLSAWQTGTSDLFRNYLNSTAYSSTVNANTGIRYTNWNRSNLNKKFASLTLGVYGQSAEYDSGVNFVAYKPTYTTKNTNLQIQAADNNGNYDWIADFVYNGAYCHSKNNYGYDASGILNTYGFTVYNDNTEAVANKYAPFTGYIFGSSGGSGVGTIALVKPSSTTPAVDWAFQLRKADGTFFEHCRMKSTGEMKFNNTADTIATPTGGSVLYSKADLLYVKNPDGVERIVGEYPKNCYSMGSLALNKELTFLMENETMIEIDLSAVCGSSSGNFSLTFENITINYYKNEHSSTGSSETEAFDYQTGVQTFNLNTQYNGTARIVITKTSDGYLTGLISSSGTTTGGGRYLRHWHISSSSANTSDFNIKLKSITAASSNLIKYKRFRVGNS